MSREHSVRTVEWATDLGRETGVPTVDEWRRASEVAEFELTSFDRREAGSFLQIAEPVIWAALIGPRRRVLVAALENAQLGLLRATAATEAEAPDEPTTTVLRSSVPARRRGRRAGSRSGRSGRPLPRSGRT